MASIYFKALIAMFLAASGFASFTALLFSSSSLLLESIIEMTLSEKPVFNSSSFKRTAALLSDKDFAL